MRMLRSLLFAIAFYPGTLIAASLAALLALATGAVGPKPLRAVVHAWARYHRWCAALLLGIRTRVEGLVPTGPVLVAAKHQSMFETIEMLLLLDCPAVVLKRQLADMPIWGMAARTYGAIPVDRQGGGAALRRMMRAAEAAVAEGRPIVIFPEGTRVPPGARPPLQPGFAGLYRAIKLPVVPVALDSGRLWPRRHFLKRPGVVTAAFGPPIPPGLPRAEIEEAVHRAINRLEPPR